MAFHFLFNRRDGDFNDKTIAANEDQGAAFEVSNRSQLSAMAEAFEQLSRSVNKSTSSDDDDNDDDLLQLKPFCDACSLVSVLFGCLGIAFKFAEFEYCGKVRDLVEASKRYSCLNNLLDVDVKNDTVRTPGSLSRNLRRVRQGLDLIRALFENFLSSDYCTLKDAASTAYAQVCAPYHTWAVRTAVSAGMYALPTREQLLLNLNETDESAEKEMRRKYQPSSSCVSMLVKNVTRHSEFAALKQSFRLRSQRIFS
ncbi:ACD11 homolog protein-like [Camellia sinensis]|uniref:ACD11 homolog protein-like n=1 Tax=Camellia sinensis TaxID=4442 RepID=UPI001035D2D0|nr:ACD11 homolog protein-like [Camellia sinensis]